MRYVLARHQFNQREYAYRIYVTDLMKAFAGSSVNIRYADLFKPEETRTADEVIDGIKGRLRNLGGE